MILLQVPKVGGGARWGTLVRCYEPIILIDARS
jgi:hypothetical protein